MQRMTESSRRRRASELRTGPAWIWTRTRLKNGLGQLVLTLVKLLHEVLERQALRRIDAGSLTAEQIENLGLTLMRQAEEIDRLRREFGLEEQDLDLDLGPLGRLF